MRRLASFLPNWLKDPLRRHRLLWLFLTRQTDLFDGTPKQMIKMDITFDVRMTTAAAGEIYYCSKSSSARAVHR